MSVGGWISSCKPAGWRQAKKPSEAGEPPPSLGDWQSYFCSASQLLKAVANTAQNKQQNYTTYGNENKT